MDTTMSNKSSCEHSYQVLHSQFVDGAPFANLCEYWPKWKLFSCRYHASQTSKLHSVEKMSRDFLDQRSCCWEDAARTGKAVDWKNNIKLTFSR